MTPPLPAHDPLVAPIRDASRRIVRELGFMRRGLAGTDLPPSAVHALIEIGTRPARPTASDLGAALLLEKSSVSRMLRKLVEDGAVRETADPRDARAKTLALTPRGRAMLAAIDRFARERVEAALSRLPPEQRRAVATGLSFYADALVARPAEQAVTIESGYRAGLIGRCAEMHARYYSRTSGFGWFFESKVAAGLADFAPRLDRSCNEIWAALHAGTIVGTVAIDGEDMGPGIGHLRWFIVDDGLRGAGIGRRLLAEAIGFCDRQGFRETRLSTFRGLDAARRLYEAHGFVLAEEKPGRQWGKEVFEQEFRRPADPRSTVPAPPPARGNADARPSTGRGRGGGL